MMPSPPIDVRYDTRDSRWLAAGHAQARIPPIDSQPVPPSNLFPTVRATRPPLQPRLCLQAKRSQQPLRSHIALPDPALKSP